MLCTTFALELKELKLFILNIQIKRISLKG